MAPVVRAEIQGPEDLRHHPPVMALVGVPDHGAQGGPIGRPRGLPFLDQVAQGLFADDREHDLAHDPVGVIEGGPGELEEEVLLAADALQVVEQLAVHPAFGPRADLVDGLGQEVDQVVRQLAAAEMHEGREPGEARRFGVSAQLMGSLDRDAPSIPFQFLGKHLVEQIGRQPDPADQLQLGQLGLDAGEARPTRIATQPEKERGGRSRLSVAVRTALRVALGLQQRFQAGTGLRRQTVSNAGIKPFLVGTDRRAHDPLDAVRRRRFDRQLTAAGLEPRHQVIGDRADHRRLIAEPVFERLGVGDRRFAIAEQGADLGTMAFGRPPRQVQRMVLGRWNVDLPGDLAHHPPIDLRAVRREPAVLAEEQQQHGEAQPVGTALGRDQCVIGRRQCPAFGEVRFLGGVHRATIP